VYPVSAAFIAAIESGRYQIANRVDVLTNLGAAPVSFRAESGTFTTDRTSANRRTCSIVLDMGTDGSYLPTDEGDLLTPFGTIIQPYSGIVLSTGTEWVPMGTFVLTDSEFDVTGAGDVTATLSASDLSWAVGNRKFLTPYQVTSSTPEVAIQAILDNVYPGLPRLSMPPSGLTLASPLPTFNEGDDPWSGILTTLDSIGYEGYFDLFATPSAHSTPDPSQAPTAWTFTDGPQGVTSGKRKWTRTGVSNHFVVSSSSSTVQPPVRGVSEDTNPMSATFVGGPFGDIPTFSTSALVATSTAAVDAASHALAVSLGSSESLQFTCLPNPAWDIDDVAALTIAKLNVEGTYVVDTISHSFDAKADTTLTCRRVAS
jgi:hypothetical protein